MKVWLFIRALWKSVCFYSHVISCICVHFWLFCSIIVMLFPCFSYIWSYFISIFHHSQNYEDNNGYMPPTYEEGTSSGGGLRMKLKQFHKRYLFCVSICLQVLMQTSLAFSFSFDCAAQRHSLLLTKTTWLHFSPARLTTTTTKTSVSDLFCLTNVK